MNNIDRHKVICEELTATYIAKNTAYGDSVSKTYNEFGLVSYITRISDKYHRISALYQGAKNEVVDESLKDTLKDLANYCILTVMELEKKHD